MAENGSDATRSRPSRRDQEGNLVDGGWMKMGSFNDSNLQVIDLQLSCPTALLQLQHTLRPLLVAKRMGDKRTLAEPRHLPRTVGTMSPQLAR